MVGRSRCALVYGPASQQNLARRFVRTPSRGILYGLKWEVSASERTCDMGPARRRRGPVMKCDAARSRSLALVLGSWLFALSGAACGSDLVDVDEEVSLEEPRVALTGLVIASDTVDITPVPAATITDPNFLIATQFTGTLPTNLPPTTGKLLVLSVRELDGAARCPTAIFVTECATMVVREQDGPVPGIRPGRLKVSVPGPVTYYPWGNLTLVPEAESI